MEKLGNLRSCITKVAECVTLLILGLQGTGLASPTATLTGRVTNSLGGILVGTQVELTNVETNTAYLAKTNQIGLYRIPNLPPGYYRVIVRMFGYRTIVRPGVKLHVQDVIALNFAMQVGSSISSVTEEEGGPLVQAETAMLSTTVNQQAMTELPSLTRNPYDFVALSPGATPASVSRGIGFAINGQRLESGSFLLDGSDNNEPYDTGPGQIVPLDSVQEYRLMTNNFTAEYGRNVGFIANVVTKSGTNEFHGVAYDFIRNSWFAANTFENNARGIPRPVFNRHQLGGAVGGPLSHDNAFFFFAIEPILVRSSAGISYYVPTPDLLAVSSAGTNAIFQRFPIPSQRSTTDVSIRTVCPYGRICGSNINTYVTIPAFAATSRTGPIDAGAGPPQNTYLLTGRIDYTFSAKTSFFGRYAFRTSDLFPTVNQPYSAQLDQSSLVQTQNATLNLTRFWHGNFYSESRLVYDRLSQSGSGVPTPGFPSFTFMGEALNAASRTISLPSGQNAFGGPQNTYQFYQTANWIKGKHNLKFGGQFVHLQDNRTLTETSPTRNLQGEFRDLSGFITGQMASFQLSLDPKGHVPGDVIPPPFGPAMLHRHYRYNDTGGFVQDSWKLSSRLTISPGLRYEYFGEGHRPGHEHVLDSSFYYGEGSNIYEKIANGHLLRVQDAPGEYQGHYYQPSPWNLGPRLGLAYDLTGKGHTILRAGMGLFFDRLPGFTAENLNPPGYSIIRLNDVSVTSSLLENPYSLFPVSSIVLPASGVIRFDQDLKTAKTGAWNLTLEKEISGKVLLTVAYIGSRGWHLYRLVNDNRNGSGEFVGRSGKRLFPDASEMITVNNLGFSDYQGLQLATESLSVRKLGLLFGANYTWSHSIDNVSSLSGDDPLGGGALPLDAFNAWLDKGSSDHDVRHRLSGHFIWQIPSLTRSEGVKKLLWAGWELSGILSFQTGQPFSLEDNRVPDREVGDNTRPLVTGAIPKVLSGDQLAPDPRTPNAFLILPLNSASTQNYSNNNCANDIPFACLSSVNGPFVGVLGRNTFRRPGTQYQNVAFAKSFDLPRIRGREGMKLQYRAEFYNFFNHPNLYIQVNSRDVGALSFNNAAGASVPGVVASFGTPDRFPQEARQIVMALKLIF